MLEGFAKGWNETRSVVNHFRTFRFAHKLPYHLIGFRVDTLIPGLETDRNVNMGKFFLNC